MKRKLTKFRVLVIHQDGEQSIFFRSSFKLCLKFVNDALLNLYPYYGAVTYYIQEFNHSVNDYVSLITCDYYYDDLPF